MISDLLVLEERNTKAEIEAVSRFSVGSFTTSSRKFSAMMFRTCFALAAWVMCGTSPVHASGGAVFQVLKQVGNNADTVAKLARAGKLARLAPDVAAARAATAFGVPEHALKIEAMLAKAGERVTKDGAHRKALTWSEQATTTAKAALHSDDPADMAVAVAYAQQSMDEMTHSEVITFCTEVPADEIKALELASPIMENPGILRTTGVSWKEVRPLAIEINNTHFALLQEFEKLSPLLNGARGRDAQREALDLVNRMERTADAWRWVEEAYSRARPLDRAHRGSASAEIEALISAIEKKWPDQRPVSKNPRLDFEENMSNAKAYLAAARGEAPPSVALGRVGDPREADSTPPPARAEPRTSVLADLAARERNLLGAEARTVSLSSPAADVLQYVESAFVPGDGPRAKVMVVREGWAEGLSKPALTSFAHALIALLLISALFIVLCPPLLAAAWIALFFLRRNQLRMELYSTDSSQSLTGRTEIGGVGKWLCGASGVLAKWCPRVAIVLLLTVLLFPVGMVFGEKSEELPGFWNLAGGLLSLIVSALTGVIAISLWQDGKSMGVRARIFAALFVGFLGWLAYFLISRLLLSPNLLFDPNFVLAAILLLAGFGSGHCAERFSRLGDIRSPESKDFDALILRSFARDADTLPIVRGKSFEATLCGFLLSRGHESMAFGQPWEIFPSGAAARVYLPMYGWERFVIRYLKMAKVVFVIPGDSKAVIWEQEALKLFSRCERVFILCPYTTDTDRRHYDAYRKNVKGKFDLPDISESGFIRFEQNWSPVFVPISLANYASEKDFYTEFAPKSTI